MKLHQINLENLNSLYGKHSIDLEGTLGDPSLFLIVGPTGSGKSTIMDAVSLALFGVTPRLSGDQGQDTRKAHHIMSHGTGSCAAEVIFSKREGARRVRYKARWSCRRAREKVTGRPQPPHRALERYEPAEGAWTILCSHHQKKVFSPHFEEVLEGLTVHDFRRSVMLAQGAFAAFIEASEDERAAILERLTETGEYKRLGQRAALWKRHAEHRLQALEKARDKLSLLSLSEVEALEEEAARLRGLLEGGDARLTTLKGRAAWLRERDALVARQAEAGAALEAARGARAARAVDLDRLARVGAWGIQTEARQLRELIAAAEGEAPARAEAIIEASTRANRAAEDVAVAEHELGVAEARAAADRARVQAASSALERTRLTALEVGEAREALEGARAAAAALRAEVEAAEAALEGTEGRAVPGAEALTRWADLRAVAPALDSDLSAYQGAVERLRRLDEKQAGELRRLQGFAEARAASEAALARRAAKLAPLTEAIEAARVALEALLDGDSVGARRAALREAIEADRARLEALRGVEGAADALSTTEANLERAEAARLESARRLKAAEEAAGAAEQARVEAERALEAASLRHREVEIIEGLSAYRASLVEGAPCPLCGSEIHPLLEALKAGDAARPETLRGLREAVEAQREALKRAEAILSAKRQAAAGASASLELLDERVADAETARDQARARLEAARAALEGPEDAEATRARVEEARGRLEALEAAELELRSRERRAEQVEAAHDEAARAHALDVERHKNAQERLEACELHHADAVDDQRAHAKRLSDKLDAVGAPPGETLEARVEHAKALLADLSALEAEIESQAEARRAAEEARAAKAEALERALAAVVSAEEALARREQAWTAAKADEPISAEEADALEAKASARVKAAARRLREVEAEQAEALAEIKAAESGAAELAERRGALTLRAAGVEGRLRSALDALGLRDEAELGPRLEDAEAATLRAEEAELGQREAVCQDRLESVMVAARAHAARPEARLEGEAPEPLEAEAAEMESELGGARERALLVQHELDQQRAREAEHASLLEAHAEAERVVALRRRLHGLIGVGEGDHFKRFAQILNLRELIAKANIHLERLAPRYRLTPAKDADDKPMLAFAVNDAHQAHDTRPLTTLSGGETFLVSLSLALALADFRHLKMPISTLLLDEGFGTLDPETLTIAMQALEKLQANGTQIGIISHVSALIERVGARVLVEKLGAGRSQIRIQLDRAQP